MEVGVLAVIVSLWGLPGVGPSAVFNIGGVLPTVAHFSSSLVSVLSLPFPVFCFLCFSWVCLLFGWTLSIAFSELIISR